MSDDWSSFQAYDDDDDLLYNKVIDKTEYAVENDSQDVKAAVGAARKGPAIDRDADPIQVIAGSFVFAPVPHPFVFSRRHFTAGFTHFVELITVRRLLIVLYDNA